MRYLENNMRTKCSAHGPTSEISLRTQAARQHTQRIAGCSAAARYPWCSAGAATNCCQCGRAPTSPHPCRAKAGRPDAAERACPQGQSSERRM